MSSSIIDLRISRALSEGRNEKSDGEADKPARVVAVIAQCCITCGALEQTCSARRRGSLAIELASTKYADKYSHWHHHAIVPEAISVGD